jgi:predicted aspartyl protease/prefoldin subunit 5
MPSRMCSTMHRSVIYARRLHVVLLAVLVCLMLPGLAYTQSGFHRYVDENGQVRYTDNPSNVPPDQYQGMPPDASGHSTSTTPDTSPPEFELPDPQRIVVNYDAKGGMILVNAVLDRHYPVLFQIDTGATRTMITEDDARMLNLPLDSADVIQGLIADGSIIEMPVVHLASIGIGEALVEDLDVTVGKLRLLGMDFLENFELNINSRAGQLVLVEKDPALLTNGLKREIESDASRHDREQAKRDIENQISQLTIAIKTCHSAIEGYQGDIEDLEMERADAESALSTARNQTRFQGSGVSRHKGNESAISRIGKNIEDIDAVIQNRRDLIKLQEKQVGGIRNRINHLRILRSRIK